MEQIQSVVSCKKIAVPSARDTAGKKRKRSGIAIQEGYCVTFNTGLSLYFSSEEVAEYYLYEEAELKHPFETLIVRVLFRRMLTAVLPFVVFTKRTETQVRQRVAELDYEELEPAWLPFREDAMEMLLTHLRELQYVDDVRYVTSYLRVQLKKPTSKRSIASELSKRGIPRDLIETALADVELDETEAARQLIQKKFSGLSSCCSRKEQAKVYRYLAGKGFSGETIRSVMRTYGEEDGVC